jgi:DNA-binding transcriptional LysR family regulator
LAEDLHFGRAAERLNVAQPALSQQIQRLERQVAVDLFLRSSRSVELTDAGRAMLEPARAALRAAALAERAAQEAARDSVHQLRVGVEMGLEDMVPTVLAHGRQHRDVALWLSRMHEPHAHEALPTSQIDAFIGFIPPADQASARRVRTTDIPLSALVRPDHPLARRGAVPLSAF